MSKFKADARDNVFVIFAKISGREYPVFYNKNKMVMRDETYAVQDFYVDGVAINDSANKKDFAYNIRRFLIYLNKKNIELSSVSNLRLKHYRNYILVESLKKKQSEVEGIKTKRTINVYIRNIYKFLAYYSLRTKNTQLIGCTENHQVKSGMFNKCGDRVDKSVDIKFYPLEFKVPSNGRQGNLSKEQIPTEADYLDLNRVIDDSHSSEFVKERDKLIIEIARKAAFRRGSIMSLNAAMFRNIDVAFEKGSMTVSPPKQKFGYELSFDIDYSLALEINSYISDVLEPYLEDKELLTKWNGALFIKVSGERMPDRYATQRISSYAKKLNWPKGKVIHVFRHLSAIDTLEEEYQKQLEIYDNDPEMARKVSSVTVKDKLGHISEEAQRSYLAHSAINKREDLELKKHEKERLFVAERAREQAEFKRLKMNFSKKSDIDFD